MPVFSEVEQIPGLYIAAGHEGDGIRLATITGKLIEEILSGKETTISIEPLRHNRFKKKMVHS